MPTATRARRSRRRVAARTTSDDDARRPAGDVGERLAGPREVDGLPGRRADHRQQHRARDGDREHRGQRVAAPLPHRPGEQQPAGDHPRPGQRRGREHEVDRAVEAQLLAAGEPVDLGVDPGEHQGDEQRGGDQQPDGQGHAGDRILEPVERPDPRGAAGAARRASAAPTASAQQQPGAEASSAGGRCPTPSARAGAGPRAPGRRRRPRPRARPPARTAGPARRPRRRPGG